MNNLERIKSQIKPILKNTASRKPGFLVRLHEVNLL